MQSLHRFSYENPLLERFTPDYFNRITQSPGVYFMLGEQNSILYIGKAKNLKKRISCYSKMKPGTSPEHILEMIEKIQSIQWLECPTESAAFMRENELLHAIRPPFNIAHTQAEHYLFIGIRKNESFTERSRKHPISQIDFQLSSHSHIQEQGYELYGCYKHRRKVKTGYTALLRLIYAATFEKKRFSYPSKITRVSPPWLYSLKVPSEWLDVLDRFLSGSSIEFLHLIINRLLENESIPTFMRPSIQDDISTVKFFYDLGPKEFYELKRKKKLRRRIISQIEMDQFISDEVKIIPLTESA